MICLNQSINLSACDTIWFLINALDDDGHGHHIEKKKEGVWDLNLFFLHDNRIIDSVTYFRVARKKKLLNPKELNTP